MNASSVICIFALVLVAVLGLATAGHHDDGIGYGEYDLKNGGWAKGVGSYGGHGTHDYSGFRGHGGHQGGHKNGWGFKAGGWHH